MVHSQLVEHLTKWFAPTTLNYSRTQVVTLFQPIYLLLHAGAVGSHNLHKTWSCILLIFTTMPRINARSVHRVTSCQADMF